MTRVALADVFEGKQHSSLEPSVALKAFFDAHLPRYQKALEKNQSDSFRRYTSFSQQLDLNTGHLFEQGGYLSIKNTPLKKALRNEIISLLVLFLGYKKPALIQEVLNHITDTFEQIPGGLSLLNDACQGLSQKDHAKQCIAILKTRRNKLSDVWKVRDLLLLKIKNANVFEKSLPCHLSFKQNGLQEIECENILRYLPGKRITFKAKWNAKDVVVKVFFDPSRGEKHFQREQKSISLLENKNINTPRLLFAGELINFKLSGIGARQTFNKPHAIVLDYIDGETLKEQWRVLEAKEERESFMKNLLSFVAQIHNQGCFQADLHLENFMISSGKILMLDADLVKHYSQPLAHQHTFNQIGLLLSQFKPKDDCLGINASKNYFEARKGIESGSNEMVEQAREKHREKVKVKLLKKIFRDCTDYITLNSFLRRYVIKRGKSGSRLMSFFTAPDTAFSKDKSLWLKNGNTCSLVRMSDGDSQYVIKRYNLKNFFHMLKRAFKKTRAKTSWENAHLLQYYGIKTPNPVGYVEKRISFIKQTSYFVMEYLDSEPLLSLLISEEVSEERKENIISEMEFIWTLFYRYRISHGDLKHTNWLVCGEKVFIIDLDSLKQHATRKSYYPLFLRDKERFLKNFDAHPSIAQRFKQFFISLQSG